MAFHVKNKASGTAAVLLASLSMITTCITAHAAEPSVTCRVVSQGINSSNQYVYDGSKTDITMSGRVLNKAGQLWYLINNGTVATSVSGVFPNQYGWWYIKDGMVDFSVNGVRQAGDGDYYIFENGKRLLTENQTVAHNDSGWWYLADGKIDFSYQGFAANEYGVWWVGHPVASTEYEHDSEDESDPANYFSGGWVNFDAYGLEQDTAGIVRQDAWLYIIAGKFDPNHSGVDSNKYGWFCVENGMVDFGPYYIDGVARSTTLKRNEYGWWYIRDGWVDFSYTGLARNENGWFYVKNGQVDFTYSGTITYNGKSYVISGGKVVG